MAFKSKRSAEKKRLSAFAKDLRRLMDPHYPDWTDFNTHDPGMTIIEVFAWLTEGLLYRANQIPERNTDPCEAIIKVLERKGVLKREEVLREIATAKKKRLRQPSAYRATGK